jgi:hypothetical protein
MSGAESRFWSKCILPASWEGFHSFRRSHSAATSNEWKASSSCKGTPDSSREATSRVAATRTQATTSPNLGMTPAVSPRAIGEGAMDTHATSNPNRRGTRRTRGANDRSQDRAQARIAARGPASACRQSQLWASTSRERGSTACIRVLMRIACQRYPLMCTCTTRLLFGPRRWHCAPVSRRQQVPPTRRDKLAYDYIRRAYGVDPKPGQRISMDGRPGIIVRPQGDPARLRVRFDGSRHVSNVHPTWEMDYNPVVALQDPCEDASLRRP